MMKKISILILFLSFIQNISLSQETIDQSDLIKTRNIKELLIYSGSVSQGNTEDPNFSQHKSFNEHGYITTSISFPELKRGSITDYSYLNDTLIITKETFRSMMNCSIMAQNMNMTNSIDCAVKLNTMNTKSL